MVAKQHGNEEYLVSGTTKKIVAKEMPKVSEAKTK